MSSIGATSLSPKETTQKILSSSAVDMAATTTTTNPLHAMVAGYCAGSSGTIVGYPLESLKVWVQTDTLGKNQHLESNQNKKKKSHKETSTLRTQAKKQFKSSGGSRRNNSTKAIYNTATTGRSVLSYSSSSAAASSISKTTNTLATRYLVKPAWTIVRTTRALYSGVSGPLATVGMVQSVNFATYDATRRFLYNTQNPHAKASQDYLTQDPLHNVPISGFCGGMATAIVTAPLLMVKIHQQITGDIFRKAIKEIFTVERNGTKHFTPLRPYGAAFVPHFFSESIGRMLYVSVYEGSKRLLLSRQSNPNTKLSLRERMACAFMSGFTTWGIFFPLDALRNNMYHEISNGRKANVLETILKMRQDGAFYRGYSIAMVRAGPVAASVLPVYDLTLEWLSSDK